MEFQRDVAVSFHRDYVITGGTRSRTYDEKLSSLRDQSFPNFMNENKYNIAFFAFQSHRLWTNQHLCQILCTSGYLLSIYPWNLFRTYNTQCFRSLVTFYSDEGLSLETLASCSLIFGR